MHVRVYQVNFPDSDRCQTLHGAAIWCALLPRTLKSSVGMLHGLFRIDVYALKLCRGIEVGVWQWEVNLSDSQRCQTLRIGASWCLLNPQALASTVRPRQISLRHSFAATVDLDPEKLRQQSSPTPEFTARSPSLMDSSKTAMGSSSCQICPKPEDGLPELRRVPCRS